MERVGVKEVKEEKEVEDMVEVARVGREEEEDTGQTCSLFVLFHFFSLFAKGQDNIFLKLQEGSEILLWGQRRGVLSLRLLQVQAWVRLEGTYFIFTVWRK